MASEPALAPAPDLSAADVSLFLDFDGTLVELAERPDGIAIAPGLPALLDRLSDRLEARVALVSGRSVAQLDALLGPPARALAVIGSHGAEVRMLGGPIEAAARPASLDHARERFAQAFADTGGIVIETKSMGVAIHYRGAAERAEAAHALASRFAQDSGLHLQTGKMMVEVRLGGCDKGSSITALMARRPFAGHRPVFLGDDATDEAGFAACAAMGGAGILVGHERATAATARLADVAAVHEWLGRL